jgi:23S rRNA (uracil1939-C5)-methyltransferase
VENPIVEKVCRHFGPCGGCDWQDLAYDAQLRRKQHRLQDLLESTLGRHAPPVEPTLGMRADASGAPWGFRTKASFVFGELPDRRGSVIGHYAMHSRTVVPITECPVHEPRANHVAFALHEHLARAQVSAAGPSLRGVLRHLIIRTTRDGREAVAMLVVTRNDKSLRAPIRAFLATEDAPDGFYLNIHDRPGPYMVGRETMRLGGRSHVRESVAGVSFLVSPTAFFQTNIEAAETMVRLVLEAAQPLVPNAKVLDLYAGSGLFALPLAARGYDVTAIDEHAQAVRDADANLRLNKIPADRVRLHAARVEDALETLKRERFDLVVLDPPRDGCAPPVRHQLFARMRPAIVVYVSCNPEALAEELPDIRDQGYDIVRVQPVDMFPHTTHIETVVTLRARPREGRRSESRSAGTKAATRR